MDAHVFRRLCDSLSCLLLGARLQKIRSPSENIYIFSFYAQAQNLTLVLQYGRRNPFLYVTQSKYNFGKTPSSKTMRLRKYLSGRKVKFCVCNWVERCIHLCLHSPDQVGQAETWLSLDLREGALLTLGQVPECLLEQKIECNYSEKSYTLEPFWAEPNSIDDFFKENTEKIENAEKLTFSPNALKSISHLSNTKDTNKLAAVMHSNIDIALNNDPRALWQVFPIFTPALRQIIPILEHKERLSLLIDLEYGGGNLYLYESHDSKKMEVFAWPLPSNLQNNRVEKIFDNPLEALAIIGDSLINAELANKNNKFFNKCVSKEVKRIEKILCKLEKEELRLKNMLSQKEDALYLKHMLWRLNPEQKLTLFPRLEQDISDANLQSEIERINSDSFLNKHVQKKILTCSLLSSHILLNPAITLSENMAKFFHQAKRGQRGLAMLGDRREVLQMQLVKEKNKSLIHAGVFIVDENETKRNILPKVNTKKSLDGKVNKKSNVGKNSKHNLLPKNIENFVSNEGFTVLRGKDAKGNLALLKIASPFDFWLHVMGGKSAHVLIKRSFSQQEISQETLEFAGILAAQKSWQKDEKKVCIQVAQACHVKPIKNEKSGTVQVDKLELTIWVNMP